MPEAITQLGKPDVYNRFDETDFEIACARVGIGSDYFDGTEIAEIYVYESNLYIERMHDDTFSVMIERTETHGSRETCEAELVKFAVNEGYFDEPRDKLIATGEAFLTALSMANKEDCLSAKRFWLDLSRNPEARSDRRKMAKVAIVAINQMLAGFA